METALLTPAETIRIADDENRHRLSLGFPELVEAVQRYRNEDGYAQTIFEKWNKENPNHIIR